MKLSIQHHKRSLKQTVSGPADPQTFLAIENRKSSQPFPTATLETQQNSITDQNEDRASNGSNKGGLITIQSLGRRGSQIQHSVYQPYSPANVTKNYLTTAEESKIANMVSYMEGIQTNKNNNQNKVNRDSSETLPMIGNTRYSSFKNQSEQRFKEQYTVTQYGRSQIKVDTAEYNNDLIRTRDLKFVVTPPTLQKEQSVESTSIRVLEAQYTPKLTGKHSAQQSQEDGGTDLHQKNQKPFQPPPHPQQQKLMNGTQFQFGNASQKSQFFDPMTRKRSADRIDSRESLNIISYQPLPQEKSKQDNKEAVIDEIKRQLQPATVISQLDESQNEHAPLNFRKVSASSLLPALPTVYNKANNKIGMRQRSQLPNAKVSGQFGQSKSQYRLRSQAQSLEPVGSRLNYHLAQDSQELQQHQQVQTIQSQLQPEFKALKTETRSVKNFKVNANVAFGGVPLHVQLQKSKLAQKQLMKHMAESWGQNQQVRTKLDQVKSSSNSINKGQAAKQHLYLTKQRLRKQGFLRQASVESFNIDTTPLSTLQTGRQDHQVLGLHYGATLDINMLKQETGSEETVNEDADGPNDLGPKMLQVVQEGQAVNVKQVKAGKSTKKINEKNQLTVQELNKTINSSSINHFSNKTQNIKKEYQTVQQFKDNESVFSLQKIDLQPKMNDLNQSNSIDDDVEEQKSNAEQYFNVINKHHRVPQKQSGRKAKNSNQKQPLPQQQLQQQLNQHKTIQIKSRSQNKEDQETVETIIPGVQYKPYSLQVDSSINIESLQKEMEEGIASPIKISTVPGLNEISFDESQGISAEQMEQEMNEVTQTFFVQEYNFNGQLRVNIEQDSTKADRNTSNEILMQKVVATGGGSSIQGEPFTSATLYEDQSPLLMPQYMNNSGFVEQKDLATTPNISQDRNVEDQTDQHLTQQPTSREQESQSQELVSSFIGQDPQRRSSMPDTLVGQQVELLPHFKSQNQSSLQSQQSKQRQSKQDSLILSQNNASAVDLSPKFADAIPNSQQADGSLNHVFIIGNQETDQNQILEGRSQQNGNTIIQNQMNSSFNAYLHRSHDDTLVQSNNNEPYFTKINPIPDQASSKIMDDQEDGPVDQINQSNSEPQVYTDNGAPINQSKDIETDIIKQDLELAPIMLISEGKFMYATMQDKTRTQHTDVINKSRKIYKPNDPQRASVFSTKPLSKLTEQSSDPTIGLQPVPSQGRRGNSDLSELSEKIRVRASGKGIKSRKSNSLQPSKVKISIKYQGVEQTEENQRQPAGKNSTNNSPNQGTKGGRKRSQKSYESAEQTNINQNKKSVGSGGELDDGYQSNLVKTLPGGLKVVQESKNSNPMQKNKDDEIILVQTDHTGLVTFHDLVIQSKLSYTKVDTMQTLDVKNLNMEGSFGGDLRQNSSHQFSMNNQPATFYRDDGSSDLEPLYDSYSLAQTKITQPTIELKSPQSLTLVIKNATNKALRKQRQPRERESINKFTELVLVPSQNSLQNMPSARRLVMNPSATLLRPSNTTNKLNNMSPLQQKAKAQQVQEQLVAIDPNAQLRNAPKGIVADRVKQSLEFVDSLQKYDYQRDKKLFGKTLKDLKAEDELRASLYCQQNFKPMQNLKDFNDKDTNDRQQSMTQLRQKFGTTTVSNLAPQKSLLSYQNALGIARKPSNDDSDQYEPFQKSVQGPERMTMRSNIQKDRRTISPGKQKNQKDLIGTQIVNANRMRQDRFHKCLDTALEKQAANLERNLQNQVSQLPNTKAKSINSLRKGNGSFSMGPSDISQQQLLGHKNEQMLGRLKVLKNGTLVAKLNPQQRQHSQVLQDFISAELEMISKAHGSQTQEKNYRKEQSDQQLESKLTYLPAMNLPQNDFSISSSARQLLNESFYQVNQNIANISSPGRIINDAIKKQLSNEEGEQFNSPYKQQQIRNMSLNNLAAGSSNITDTDNAQPSLSTNKYMNPQLSHKVFMQSSGLHKINTASKAPLIQQNLNQPPSVLKGRPSQQHLTRGIYSILNDTTKQQKNLTRQGSSNHNNISSSATLAIAGSGSALEAINFDSLRLKGIQAQPQHHSKTQLPSTHHYSTTTSQFKNKGSPPPQTLINKIPVGMVVKIKAQERPSTIVSQEVEVECSEEEVLSNQHKLSNIITGQETTL